MDVGGKWRFTSRGSAQQMAFDFAVRTVDPETPAERLTWEHHILGQPLSVHPLDVVAQNGQSMPLSAIKSVDGRSVQTQGIRLPGWTGSKGFFVGDQREFVVARPVAGLASPKVWEPLQLSRPLAC